jgi:hypothetical protein
MKSTLTGYYRAAGFIDLVLLVTANLVMKTRLPSRRERPDAKPVDVKAILSDFGYWLCIIGSVLLKLIKPGADIFNQCHVDVLGPVCSM